MDKKTPYYDVLKSRLVELCGGELYKLLDNPDHVKKIRDYAAEIYAMQRIPHKINELLKPLIRKGIFDGENIS